MSQNYRNPSWFANRVMSRQLLGICHDVDARGPAVSFHFHTLTNGISLALYQTLSASAISESQRLRNEMKICSKSTAGTQGA
jgi:hypothetical protein